MGTSEPNRKTDTELQTMSVDATLRYHSFRILIVYILLQKSEFLLC
jgi:hypothetical protein